MRAAGQEWLNNLGNTADELMAQDERLWNDTFAAYDQSIQLRDNQAMIAQQESDRQQMEYQRQVEAQNAVSRQQFENQRAEANNRMEEMRRQRAENLERLSREREQLEARRQSQKPNVQVANATSPTSTSGANSGSISIDLGRELEPTGASGSARTRNEIEALAFCWQTEHENWLCDGKVQGVSISDENFNVVLDLVHCANYRKMEPFANGRIFFCGDEMINLDGNTGRLTWNHDISGWYSLPQSILNQRLTSN